MDAVTFDFTRAPFRLNDRASPQQVAGEIIACYRRVADLPDRVTQSFRAAMQAAEIADAHPLLQAGERIARDIDAGIGAGDGNPYHNRQHFCEVLLAALYLLLAAPLTQAGRVQLLVAALAHDFHHDGKGFGDATFRLERVAVEAMLPYLAASGVPQDECTRISAMILATEISTGMPFARRCYRHFFEGGAQPDAAGIGEPLAMLARDANLARQAVLLTEADVLPSVGLTLDYSELSRENLSSEWGKPLSDADNLNFLERVFGDFMVNRFFSPNVSALKEALRIQAGKRVG
ncbi:MAG: hypothetical protein HY322_21500 [Betaproteobacteria bacterium]|nr:hypothetical protein [Betaproteobacteria bacterium]